jgi:dynein heavy chain
MIEMRLEKLRRTQLGPPPGKRLALFVDDVNMPALEQYGAAPPVELLRLLLDRGGLYDRTKPFWKDVTDVTLVCACGPPGGGRSALTPRFVRHHHVLCFPQPSAHSLRAILSAIVGGFLAQRPLEVRPD